MRVRPYTRCTLSLTIALATSLTGAGSAAAVSLPIPTVPTVTVPQLSVVPAPVNNVVDGVNGVTSGATDTVNNTTQSLGNTVDNTLKNPGSVTQNSPVPLPSNPVTGNQTPGTPNKTGPSSGSGSGAAGASSGGSGNLSPSVSGGGSQARRSSAQRQRATQRARRAAARRRARARAGGVAAAVGAKRSAATSGPASAKHGSSSSTNPVAQVINNIQKVIPLPVKILIAVLALAAFAFFVHSRLALRRARRLESQREELLGDVGLLQRALLPDVPTDLRGLDVSVAYRPAEGPAAGGDFYDVFELDGGRTAIIVGDVCGHGRAALAVTALMRYTLRAYAAAGFEPRVALQVAARALDGHPDGALTTVVLAVYDPDAGTLTYACAGHEPPIVLGPAAYEPVTPFSSPPLGSFMATGQRQTTVALPPRSSVCFFTDGLVEARLGDDMIGRQRLTDVLANLDPEGGAQLLLEQIAASADRAPDDMAACLVRSAPDAVAADVPRVEELEADSDELAGERVGEFLAACGVQPAVAVDALRAARAKAAEFGGAVLRVHEGRVDVAPREVATLPVPSLDDAARRAALELRAS